MPKDWYVYIIRCSDKSLYTGISTDVVRRFAEHQAQGNKTAKYLRGKQPLQLALQIKVNNRSNALVIENKIKKLSKSQKEQLLKMSAQHLYNLLVCQQQ